MGIKGLIQKESHKNKTMIATNDELAVETEQRLKKSLDRIDSCSEIIWNAIEQFKEPKDVKNVLALTNLVRTMKETIEVNLKYVGGVYSPGQTINIENQQTNIVHNDIDFAAKVARQMDTICDTCKYKQKYDKKNKVIDV